MKTPGRSPLSLIEKASYRKTDRQTGLFFDIPKSMYSFETLYDLLCSRKKDNQHLSGVRTNVGNAFR